MKMWMGLSVSSFSSHIDDVEVATSWMGFLYRALHLSLFDLLAQITYYEGCTSKISDRWAGG